MNQPASISNEVIAYALQRRGLITKACEAVKALGLPVDRGPHDPADALRALAYNWAVNVNPDLMRWYRDAAQDTQAKCRLIHMKEGIEEVTGIERLVLRDLKLFTRAIDAYQALPDDMQKHIMDATATIHTNSAVVSPLRLASVVPGSLLLAWDGAWKDAIETFSERVGDVAIQDPAAIDGFHNRIDEIEEVVQVMRNRFVAISAAAEIPPDYGRG